MKKSGAESDKPVPYGVTVPTWGAEHGAPPGKHAMMLAGEHVVVRRGEEQASRFVPLVYDHVRSDIARIAGVKVSRAAIQKVGPLYRGVIDSHGEPVLFSMSGGGIFTARVKAKMQPNAWKAFYDLIDREYKKSVEKMRAQ